MIKGHLRHGRVALGQPQGNCTGPEVYGAVTPVCHLHLLKDMRFIVNAQVLFRYKSIIATLAFIQFCFYPLLCLF